MPQRGDVITSPRMGQTITFLATAADTDGEYLALEARLDPGSRIVPHVHLLQEERFEILEGEPTFTVGRERLAPAPGEELVVAPRTRHAFRNRSDDPVRVRVTLTPALQTERLFDILFSLDRAGSVNRFGAPGPLRTAALAREHGDGFFWLAGVPVGIQRAALGPLGRLARSTPA